MLWTHENSCDLDDNRVPYACTNYTRKNVGPVKNGSFCHWSLFVKRFESKVSKSHSRTALTRQNTTRNDTLNLYESTHKTELHLAQCIFNQNTQIAGNKLLMV